MTRDAKIGLLLGLVFIFVIAFIINGLPGSGRRQNSNELTTHLVGPQTGSPGLAAKERKVPLALSEPWSSPPGADRFSRPAGADTAERQVRFSMPLPQVSPGAGKPEAGPATGGSVAGLRRDTPQAGAKGGPAKRVLPRFYVVREGDTLSTIAEKLYGPGSGGDGLAANVKRIFEANNGTLGSADEIYVGQKLIIPPAANAGPARGGWTEPFSGRNFVKADSIGKRHIVKGKTQPRQGRVWVVREGDSLWQIAAEQLGDGSRYKEIVRLNREKIKDEDELTTGMRLSLPAR